MRKEKPTSTKAGSLERQANGLDDSESTKKLTAYQPAPPNYQPAPPFPLTPEQTLDRAIFRINQGEKLFQVALLLEGQP